MSTVVSAVVLTDFVTCYSSQVSLMAVGVLSLSVHIREYPVTHPYHNKNLRYTPSKEDLVVGDISLISKCEPLNDGWHDNGSRIEFKGHFAK